MAGFGGRGNGVLGWGGLRSLCGHVAFRLTRSPAEPKKVILKKAFFLAIATGLAVGLVVLFIGKTLFDWNNGGVAAGVGGAVGGLMITRSWKQRSAR